MNRWLITVLILFAGSARATEPEILDPAVAFKVSAKVVSDSSLQVTYDIAPGYYLYREKFAFASESAKVKLGEANIPHGKVKQDEFFGRIETLRNQARIVIPFSRDDNLQGRCARRESSKLCPNHRRAGPRRPGAYAILVAQYGRTKVEAFGRWNRCKAFQQRCVFRTLVIASRAQAT